MRVGLPESEPSEFFRAREGLLLEAGRLGPVLDLACGYGRHSLAAAQLGLPVLALDRDEKALRTIQRTAPRLLQCVRTDLEAGSDIPVAPASCGAVLVFRFLFRPLARAIVEALRPGGLLLYETFTSHQRDLGQGPRNSAFLLEPDELPRLFGALQLIAYEEVVVRGPRPAALARLVARRRANAQTA
jgi:SAM-dependent methyltransferase